MLAVKNTNNKMRKITNNREKQKDKRKQEGIKRRKK